MAAAICTILGSGCSDRPQDTPIVASITLDNGNTVEFYDEGNAAMIRESGKAYVTPRVHRMQTQSEFKGASHLVDLFKALSPDAVPPELVALQLRLTTPSDTNAAASPDTSVVRAQLTAAQPSGSGTKHPPDSSAGGKALSAPSGKVTTATEVGCTNGCCDASWMRNTFEACTLNDTNRVVWDWEAMNFNLGWSWMHINDAYDWDGFICSASGTSNWLVEGSGVNNFSVPEGHFDESSWTFGSRFYDQDYYIQANDPSNMHLHSMCGAEFYDYL
jgi:hypothetical protein